MRVGRTTSYIQSAMNNGIASIKAVRNGDNQRRSTLVLHAKVCDNNVQHARSTLIKKRCRSFWPIALVRLDQKKDENTKSLTLVLLCLGGLSVRIKGSIRKFNDDAIIGEQAIGVDRPVGKAFNEPEEV